MRATADYRELVTHYEACLERHGDTHLGVDWPNATDARTRYQVMLDVIRRGPGERVTLLDFGCGAAHLYEFMLEGGYEQIVYSGLDLSPRFVELSRRKFPDCRFYNLDVLEPRTDLPQFDYVVMNGVFTERQSLSIAEMFEFIGRVLRNVFVSARRGMAFNVMSIHVDWERDDLMHASLDRMAELVVQHLSRNFVIRQDYGLYEYTMYVYREMPFEKLGCG